MSIALGGFVVSRFSCYSSSASSIRAMSIGLALQPWMFYVTTWTAHAFNARQPHLIFSDPVAVWGLLSYGLLRLDNFTNPPKLGVGETYTAEAYILPFHSF